MADFTFDLSGRKALVTGEHVVFGSAERREVLMARTQIPERCAEPTRVLDFQQLDCGSVDRGDDRIGRNLDDGAPQGKRSCLHWHALVRQGAISELSVTIVTPTPNGSIRFEGETEPFAGAHRNNVCQIQHLQGCQSIGRCAVA